MDYTCRTKTLQALSKAMEKQTISLSYKLQREEGQWNRKKKTDLIDSLLRKYPINPTYGIKQNGVISIIDGVQRLSCVRDFISDKFALSKDMEPVTVNGEEKSLGGLKFSKLDDDTKEAILNSELQLYELTECTEKDIREMTKLSHGQINNTLRLLNLSKEVKKLVVNGKLSYAKARLLVVLSSEDQLRYANKFISLNLSVRECEKLVRGEEVTNTYESENDKLIIYASKEKQEKIISLLSKEGLL